MSHRATIKNNTLATYIIHFSSMTVSIDTVVDKIKKRILKIYDSCGLLLTHLYRAQAVYAAGLLTIMLVTKIRPLSSAQSYIIIMNDIKVIKHFQHFFIYNKENIGT